jgi:hypothetical protein
MVLGMTINCLRRIIMRITQKEFRFLQRNLTTVMHACEYAVEDSRFAEDYEWNLKELELCKQLIAKIEDEAMQGCLEED